MVDTVALSSSSTLRSLPSTVSRDNSRLVHASRSYKKTENTGTWKLLVNIIFILLAKEFLCFGERLEGRSKTDRQKRSKHCPNGRMKAHFRLLLYQVRFYTGQYKSKRVKRQNTQNDYCCVANQGSKEKSQILFVSTCWLQYRGHFLGCTVFEICRYYYTLYSSK